MFSTRFLFDKMSIHLNVLGSIILNWVMRNFSAGFLSPDTFIYVVGANPISAYNFLSQISSKSPLDISLNSILTFDNSTTFYFLLLYVAKLSQTKVKYFNVNVYQL